MKKYFWMSGKRLLYRAFYRYGLIPPLDSQHPPLGPGPATQLSGLHQCCQTMSMSTSDPQRDYGPKVSYRRSTNTDELPFVK